MANITESPKDEVPDLKAQLDKCTHNELQRIALGSPMGDQQPNSDKFRVDQFGYPIGEAMKLDAVLEAADEESDMLEIKYGTENASNIAKHMAVSIGMRQDYRGDVHSFVDDMKEDVATITEMYIEPVEIARSRYIRMAETRIEKCNKCPGGCEYCGYANYRVISRGE